VNDDGRQISECEKMTEVLVCEDCHVKITQRNFWSHKCDAAYVWIEEADK
jgi:hypothetical protein